MSWDLGLDYQQTYNMLLKELKKARNQNGTRSLARRAYLAVLLTKLRNGSRLREAVDAVIEFYKQKKKVVEVRVQKKKKEEYRKMVMPKELKPGDIKIAAEKLIALIEKYENKEDLTDEEKKNRVTATISAWAKKYLKIKTHCLRYAYITQLVKKGYNPAVIAKITHHSKLERILDYTQQKIADEILLSE